MFLLKDKGATLKKWAIYLSITILGGSVIISLLNKETNALALAHKRIGWQVECKKVGRDWAACKLGDSSTVTAWYRHQDGWLTGNGKAMQVIDQIQSLSADELRNLPDMAYMRDGPVAPDSVLNAFRG